MRLAILGTIILGVSTLALGVGTFLFESGSEREFSSLVKTFMPGLPTYLLGGLMAIGGLFLGQLRGIVYALTFMTIGVTGALMGFEPGWMMLLSGSIVLTTGALYLTRFMLKYPIPETPAHA